MSTFQYLPGASEPASAIERVLRKSASAIVVVVWAIARFWNIPPLGTIDPHRSPLHRHNWYI